ncbi:MAG: hypothetical protein ACRDD7_12600 [Peptostreptococcaceae bacterium]
MGIEKVLISYDSKQDKIFTEKIKDAQNEYKDKEILCGTTIVCSYTDHSSIKAYTRLLIKEVNKEQVKEILKLNKQLCEANRIYINTVNQLI